MTLAADGRPRPVPIAYAFDDGPGALVVYSALDEKRKAVADPHALARVRDIGMRPRVAVLVDHWEEDWAHLAWVRLDGTATVLEPPQGGAEHAHAIRLLRARYPQYATHALETRPILRIAVERVSGWSAMETRA